MYARGGSGEYIAGWVQGTFRREGCVSNVD